MYNPQLETFIKVADAGNFNKAAEEIYIAPTAVIKQINLLEGSLDVKLFERTHRGLILTKAGKSLYQDSKYIIRYCEESVVHAKNAMRSDDSVIRIGTSPMTSAQLLVQLCSKIQVYCPELKFELIPFENTPKNAREILANLVKIFTYWAGLFDETMLSLQGCAGLELSRESFCCAVSVHHRLAAIGRLKIEDLYGGNLLLMKRNRSSYVDRLRDEIWKNHMRINIIDFDFYNMSIFNRCENNSDILPAIPGWASIILCAKSFRWIGITSFHTGCCIHRSLQIRLNRFLMPQKRL